MKKKLLFSMFAVALLAPLNLAFALTPEEIQAQRDENRQAIQEQREADIEAAKAAKEQRIEARCNNIQTRLETRINRYENNGQMFETVFGNMLARITRLSERLEAKGVDVSTLKTDIATLEIKINKLFSDQDTFMQTLEDAKAVTCTEADQTNSEIKGKMGEARTVLQTLHQDRLDIRSYFKETIKPDVLAIRQQLASQETTTTETE